MPKYEEINILYNPEFITGVYMDMHILGLGIALLVTQE